MNAHVEADHGRVGFYEDITWAGVYVPIFGMFTRGLIIGTFPKFLMRQKLWNKDKLGDWKRDHGEEYYGI